jgi:murein DD-endopeptidase MepM/ murein hydrolase activator NlpD
VIAAVLAATLACLLPPVDAPVVRPFQAPACQWCPGHRGIEYATAAGEPVRAAAAGVVTFVGRVAGVRYVVVRHIDGLRATYGGLATPAAANPTPVGPWQGRAVQQGAVLGVTVGHLHFGLRDGDQYLDPAPLLAVRRDRPRLVPGDGNGRRPGRASPPSCRAEVRVAPGAR